MYFLTFVFLRWLRHQSIFSFYARRRNNAAFKVFRIVWTTKKAVYSRLSR
nr:MAG TPA: hypothetical protein [Caudoviricetes sp.]